MPHQQVKPVVNPAAMQQNVQHVPTTVVHPVQNIPNVAAVSQTQQQPPQQNHTAEAPQHNPNVVNHSQTQSTLVGAPIQQPSNPMVPPALHQMPMGTQTQAQQMLPLANPTQGQMPALPNGQAQAMPGMPTQSQQSMPEMQQQLRLQMLYYLSLIGQGGVGIMDMMHQYPFQIPDGQVPTTPQFMLQQMMQSNYHNFQQQPQMGVSATSSPSSNAVTDAGQNIGSNQNTALVTSNSNQITGYPPVIASQMGPQVQLPAPTDQHQSVAHQVQNTPNVAAVSQTQQQPQAVTSMPQQNHTTRAPQHNPNVINHSQTQSTLVGAPIQQLSSPMVPPAQQQMPMGTQTQAQQMQPTIGQSESGTDADITQWASAS